MCEEGVGRGSKLVQLESSRMQALLESQFNPEKMRDPKVVAEPYKPTRKLVEPPTVKEPPVPDTHIHTHTHRHATNPQTDRPTQRLSLSLCDVVV